MTRSVISLLIGAFTLVALLPDSKASGPGAVGVCDIIDHPYDYNGKLIRVSGYLDGCVLEGIALGADEKWKPCHKARINWPAALQVSLLQGVPSSFSELLSPRGCIKGLKVTATARVEVDSWLYLRWLLASARHGHGALLPIHLHVLTVTSESGRQ